MIHICGLSQQKHLSNDRSTEELSTYKVVYRCDGCMSKFDSICTLHQHIKTHSEGGSYYYNHVIQTAFPRFDTVCRNTQTDKTLSLLSRAGKDQESFKEKPYIGRKIMKNRSEDCNVSTQGHHHEQVLDDKDDVKSFTEDGHDCEEKALQVFATKDNSEPTGLEDSRDENSVNDNLCEKRNETKINYVDKVFSDVENNECVFSKIAFKGEQKDEYENDNNILRAETCNINSFCDDLVNGTDSLADLNSSSLTEENQVGFDVLPGENKSSFDNDFEERNEDNGTENFSNEAVKPSRTRQQRTKKIQRDPESDTSESSSLEGQKVTDVTEQESKQSHRLSYLKCEYCDCIFKLKNRLRKHVLKAHQEDDLKCNRCEMSFSESYKLKKHISLKHENQGKEYHENNRKLKKIRVDIVKNNIQTEKYWKCEPCGKKYKTESGLYFHNEAKHSGKIFTCEYCNAEFSLSMSLKCHLIEIHSTGKKGHPCKICPKVFAYKSKLLNHMKVRHPTEEDEKSCMVCEYCGKTYAAKVKLNNHLKKCGNQEKTFCCSKCPYKAFTKTTLRYHIEAMHESELKYMCHICGKYLKNRFYMRTHLRIHSEDRNFPCEKCGKKFKLKTMLKRHENIHKNLKKFHCKICGKTFVQNNNLKAHMRQHTGEKPFKCDFCEKTFAHNISRKNHMSKCDMK